MVIAIGSEKSHFSQVWALYANLLIDCTLVFGVKNP